MADCDLDALPLVDAPLRQIARPRDVVPPPGARPRGLRERVAIVFFGALAVRNVPRNNATDVCWQSGAFDRVLFCDLPHVLTYGVDSAGRTPPRGNSDGNGAGTVMSQREAMAIVRVAVFPVLRSGTVETVTLVGYSMGAVVAAHLWSDFEAVCAHHFPSEPSRLRAVLIGCGLSIPPATKRLPRTGFALTTCCQFVAEFFTPASARAFGPAQGANFDLILRCVREWIAAPGPTLFLDDAADRKRITSNPLVHFVSAVGDVVYPLGAIFVHESPPSPVFDLSAVAYADVQSSVRRALDTREFRPHGASLHTVPGDHFTLNTTYMHHMREALRGAIELLSRTDAREPRTVSRL